eukprot:5654441-Pyramimonas_sp.AAC.1
MATRAIHELEAFGENHLLPQDTFLDPSARLVGSFHGGKRSEGVGAACVVEFVTGTSGPHRWRARSVLLDPKATTTTAEMTAAADLCSFLHEFSTVLASPSMYDSVRVSEAVGRSATAK